MGGVFEQLIRKFAELSNETAGEHFTPREVIRLMANLLFIGDDEALAGGSIVRHIHDPTAGTGGMLSVAGEHIKDQNPQAVPVMYGQELNPESYAICKACSLLFLLHLLSGAALPTPPRAGAGSSSRGWRSGCSRALIGEFGRHRRSTMFSSASAFALAFFGR